MTMALLDALEGKNQGNIAQLVAMKEGRVLLDACFNGFTPDDNAQVMSVTKSVFSLLIGIAIDKGLIGGVDDRVLDYFPDYQSKRGEKTLPQITLRHLLTMTAPWKSRSEPYTRVYGSEDWTTASLDILGGKAGLTGSFRYFTVGLQVLAGVLAKASGESTLDFANRCLFAPLGIAPRLNAQGLTAEENAAFILDKQPKGRLWRADPKGVNTPGWGLCLSARDMAKIGQLCLDGGEVGGRRLISRDWLRQSFTTSVRPGEAYSGLAYGFLWWIVGEKTGCVAAIGDGGNVIYIDPEKQIVVAVTATFKPRVFDRVAFIRESLVPLLDA